MPFTDSNKVNYIVDSKRYDADSNVQFPIVKYGQNRCVLQILVKAVVSLFMEG